jgi:hypothetical protein
LQLQLSDTPLGRQIYGELRARRWEGRRSTAISTLTLPSDLADYSRGRPRQAFRTNCSRAVRAGTSVQSVGRKAEIMARIHDLFARRDPSDEGSWYRQRAELGEGEFWVATGADDETLVLAEVLADRGVALLRSMISAQSPGSSDARYLLTGAIVAEMTRRGVSHLVVGRSLSLPPGLIYFQRLLGFTPTNLLISPPSTVGR